MYNPEEKLLRLGSFHFSFVFYSVSPVSWPACLPVLVSSQSDGIQHRTLFGPPAAYRRIREEESPAHRIWGFPETPKRTTQIMCTYPFSSFLPSRVAVDIVKAALYRSEFDYCFCFFRIGMKRSLESPVWPWGHRVWQRRTPWSRTGIINLRSSSLNLALMKPVYVQIFPLPALWDLESAHKPTCLLFSTSILVPCLSRIYEAPSPPRMLAQKWGYV